jgi:fatty-acyl-CoA synthase
MPCLRSGAICVPLNYRLTPNDFVYLINHSGSEIVCAHSDFLDAVNSVRSQLPNVKSFVALEGQKEGWLDYETLLANASPNFNPVSIAESDVISINYTSGTTSRPKGVMITHRNAYMNVVGTLIHISMSPRDRYLWTVPMFHANGWTFIWIVTAVGGVHVCLRKVEPTSVFELIKTESVSMLCAAPSVLISIANAPADVRSESLRGVKVLNRRRPTCRGDNRTDRGRVGLDDHPVVRSNGNLTLYYNL